LRLLDLVDGGEQLAQESFLKYDVVLAYAKTLAVLVKDRQSTIKIEAASPLLGPVACLFGVLLSH
jgi:hypothetical protein